MYTDLLVQCMMRRTKLWRLWSVLSHASSRSARGNPFPWCHKRRNSSGVTWFRREEL